MGREEHPDVLRDGLCRVHDRGGVCSGGVGVSDGRVLTPDDPNNLYSDIIPTHRLSTTEEIAATVVFLASDYSSNTTGQVVVVDGGASQIGF